MNEASPSSSVVLSFGTLARLFAAFGFFGGAVSAIVYSVANLGEESLANLLLVFALSPLFQAGVMVVYALIGYPFYRRLAGKARFGLGQLSFRS